MRRLLTWIKEHFGLLTLKILGFAIPLGLYTLALYLYIRFGRHYELTASMHWLAYLTVLVLAWAAASHWFSKRAGWPRVNRLILLVVIWAAASIAYVHVPAFSGWGGTPTKSYWHLLADAFLHGRLYLIDPPTFHDLTLFNGNWYVPNPPMPALVMLPYTWAVGPDGVSTTAFSAVFGGLNAVLMFLVLEQAAHRGWVQVSFSGRLWLTALFALGTPNLWLAGNGRMWFVSQVLTLTFCLLAAWLALARRSPWLVGTALGMAVAARSNVFVLWPFLVSIFLEILKDEYGQVKWKPLVSWMVQSAVPVVLAVFGLLAYNAARFNNPLDFGYLTINGDPKIVQDVQAYGMFHPHFLARNLRILFLGLPRLTTDFSRLFPLEGLSLWVTTPALFFLIARYPRRWWTAGAWLSVLLSIGMLALYHNSGANQFGYRYLLDFAVPLWLLLAAAIGRKPGRLFYVLVMASIAINLLGALWFYLQ